jgi:hypothetical protein
MLVPYTGGETLPLCPVLRLERRDDGGMFDAFAVAFQDAWADGQKAAR